MAFVKKIYGFIRTIVFALEPDSADEFTALDFIFEKIDQFFAQF